MPLKVIINKPAPIKLSQPLAPNSAAAPADVLQAKRTLNRLGYYTPPKNIGITDIPDSGLFSAIKAFQKALGITMTGTLNPDDQTIETLNAELEKPKTGYYIWHTVGDSHVRGAHKALEGTIHSWETSPTPGEDFGCRCWAEAVQTNIPPIYDPPIEPVYPEMILIPLLRTGKLAKGALSLMKSLLDKNPKLNKMQAENLNRFIKKIPANSKSTVKINKLRNGNIRFQATSQGKVEGSKAIYEKTVDTNGETIQYLKTTIGKNNQVIHIKNKM